MPDRPDFDLIVIGGGPAGYVASIRGAQLGLKVLCVEKSPRLGGTCLNVGCIPSKALLESSEQFLHAQHNFASYGIVADNLRVDVSQMMKHKDSVVNQLGKGIEALFRKNGVQRIHGTGRLLKAERHHQVEVQTESNRSIFRAKNVLIATGSEAIELPFLKFDGKFILSSTEALSLKDIPGHLAVVGAGYVGLEMASVWLRLGSKVTIIEYLDRILPLSDQQASQQLLKALKKQGMQFLLNTSCKSAKVNENKVVLLTESRDGTSQEITADTVLVATGRKPFSESLGLDDIGVKCDEKGRAVVNQRFETNIPGIYAVGDLISGPMLAHKASEEGVAAVEGMAGHAVHVNYHAIPSIIYTSPELAAVGFTEEELKAKHIEYKSGVFPFLANARAKAMLEVDGFAKVLADATTDRVLGVHIVGPNASELIHEAVCVIEFGGSSEDIARICHAHPTLSEVLKEASLGVHQRMLHF